MKSQYGSYQALEVPSHGSVRPLTNFKIKYALLNGFYRETSPRYGSTDRSTQDEGRFIDFPRLQARCSYHIWELNTSCVRNAGVFEARELNVALGAYIAASYR